MHYIYLILILSFVHTTTIAQKIELHFATGLNLTSPSFNDNIYSYPPIPANSGYYSYSRLPSNIYRTAIPKPGLQIQGDAYYKFHPKLSVSSGLKFQLFRYGMNRRFEENPLDPFGKRWDSYNTNYGIITTRPNLVFSPSDYKIHTRLLYITIPLLLNYQVNPNTLLFSGINLSTPLYVAQIRKSLQFQSISNYRETNLTDNSKSAFQKLNVGAQVGVRSKISKYAFIKIEFIKYFKNTYSSKSENAEVKSFINTLNIGYDWLLN